MAMRPLLIFIASLLIVSSEAGWGTSEKKVRLTDVNVLTLYHGKMTNGRRSSPVPQLDCTNDGTAPCSAFSPKVVQCTNRGSDGYDVQWECKTDMDNAFRFGNIDVSCEGYDYPEDPYILHGSCGLKYSIDYTEEGLHKKSQHSYYGNNQGSHSSYSYQEKSKSSMSTIIADLIVYIGMGLVVYALYRTCTNSGRNVGEDAYSSTNDDSPSSGGGGGHGGGGYGWFGGNQQPPPPPYTPGYQDDASCRNRSTYNRGSGMGGFWTGAATGGLLGYMFGNNGNRQGGWWGGGNGYGYGGRGYAPSGGSFFSSGFGGSSSSSTGTRSASGFGGTSRR